MRSGDVLVVDSNTLRPLVLLRHDRSARGRRAAIGAGVRATFPCGLPRRREAERSPRASSRSSNVEVRRGWPRGRAALALRGHRRTARSPSPPRAVAVAERLRYWYDPVCHLLAQKAANNVSSLVLRAIPWSPAVHSLFPRGPRAIVRTVLLATARGAVAVPFDVVVSKILPFAITLQRGGSDDDPRRVRRRRRGPGRRRERREPHSRPERGGGRRLGRRPRTEPLERRRRLAHQDPRPKKKT